ncbi:polysaccharide deacetylase family protein [Nocardioides sp. BP30]|uniref:polysaccharide deacetylase family protein n=1 Tax=Nocardioides sp. BP30 TaxID=3036374 RepID=UPI002468F1D3|nr:polysaccharide deacetylase family protein [Nocardioides sp. BP30]WGL51911.1 polysaccharide deacetylase family protein [Nocardioides sp. BP30]
MSLTIVMYHYVRDLRRSRYPEIKGRDTEEFRRQLGWLAAHHSVVSTAEVIAASRGEAELPPDAAWLTFDDGYLDHWTTVFPLLHERGWHGAFFPPARPVRDGALLDVNRIQFILAACADQSVLVDRLRSAVAEHSGEDGVLAFDDYWHQLARPSRWDPAETIFVKRMLQRALPERLRREVARSLFAEFVSVDERAFCAELYVSEDQLRTMIRSGMYVGNHTSSHPWLDSLSTEEQAAEIDDALGFLGGLGAPTSDWVMAYPYGGYDASLLGVVAERGAALGVTVEASVADVSTDHPLTLPRLDTNDLSA